MEALNGNGKEIKIAILQERIDNVKEDLREWKLHEKDEGQHSASQRAELYAKCDQLVDRLNEVKLQVTKIATTIAVIGTVTSIATSIIIRLFVK